MHPDRSRLDVRLHGPGANKYQGDYSKKILEDWAKKVAAWTKELNHVFVYFDNDQNGFAAKNALELKEILGPHVAYPASTSCT